RAVHADPDPRAGRQDARLPRARRALGTDPALVARDEAAGAVVQRAQRGSRRSPDVEGRVALHTLPDPRHALVRVAQAGRDEAAVRAVIRRWQRVLLRGTLCVVATGAGCG